MALAVITGASSGLGEEFARQLHERGFDLLVIARRGERLRTLAHELNARRSASVESLVADLSQPGTSASPGWSQVEEVLRGRDVDILINNAGIGSFGFFDELDVDLEEAMVRLNVIAPLRLAHAVLPRMKARRSGSIIWTSSVAAFQPLPLMATYAATKEFELSQVLALHAELRSFGVRVCACCPGPTATEFAGVARVPGTVTGGFRDRVCDVVRATLRDLDRGVVVSLPTWRAGWMAIASRVLPRTWSARILFRKLLRPYQIAKQGAAPRV